MFDYVGLKEEVKRYAGMNSLETNPVKIGFDGINAQLAVIQRVRDRLTEILSEVISEKGSVEEALGHATYNYERACDKRFLNDDVKDLKNKDLQKAKANETLLSELMTLQDRKSVV